MNAPENFWHRPPSELPGPGPYICVAFNDIDKRWYWAVWGFPPDDFLCDISYSTAYKAFLAARKYVVDECGFF